MDWQSQLIVTYLIVSDFWRKGGSELVRRHSNNNRFALTDEEAATIYLFGILSGHTTVKSIYTYASRHLIDWFPDLGGYEAFCYRLNKISDGFIALCQDLAQSLEKSSSSAAWVIDSLPVVLAGPKRSGQARVAPELANKGYCASKDLYFYGVKIHCVGAIRAGALPIPSHIGLAPASNSDNRLFEQVSPDFFNGQVYADLAYADSEHKQTLDLQQNIELLTPRKRKKGLHSFPGSDAFSSCVSAIRQPIESLFNWLQEKTKIQNASKVRSSSGLIVHIFGKFAAAMILMSLTV